MTSSVFVLSIDTEEELVSLSLLPKDTGKSDVLPESLGLPRRLIGEEDKKCDAQKNNKRKLSESEQVTRSLTDLHAGSVFKHGRQIYILFHFPMRLNVLLDCFQVSKKKKKKKSKADGNDSGVEVYFREDEVDDDRKPQFGSVKVGFSPHPATNFLIQNRKINKMNFSQQEAHSSAGPSRLQVAAGFSWDVGLNSLKPVSAVQESESSDEEEYDKSDKVKRIETSC